MRSGATQSDDRDEPRYSGPERRSPQAYTDEVAPVRLTHKYAEAIDGIDLSERQIGDRLPLPSHESRMLIAEGWAEPVASEDRRNRDSLGHGPDDPDAVRSGS